MSKISYIKLRENIHLLINEGDREIVNLKAYYTAGGSWFEDSSDRGKKHLLEHCIVARTSKMNHEEFKNFERRYGLLINAFTSPLKMGLEFKGHKSEFDTLLSTLSECLFNPTFDQADLDREKEIVIREIAERSGDPSYILYYDSLNAFFEEGYQTHQTLGDADLVAQTTLEDFKKLNKQSLEDGHIVFTIDGGDIDVEKVKETVLDQYNKYLKENKGDAKPKYSVYYRPESRIKDHTTLGFYHPLAHEHVDLSFYIPLPLTLENLAERTIFTNLYLNYGGILYDRLRDEKQLVYGIVPYFDMDTGHMVINLTCEEKYVDQIIKETGEIFEDFDRYFDVNKFNDYLFSSSKKQSMAKDDLHKSISFSANVLMQYGQFVDTDTHIENLKKVTPDSLKSLFEQVSDGFINRKTLLVSKNKTIEKYSK